MGAQILDAPQEYTKYEPGYYAVFFLDPDGIKLECVFPPISEPSLPFLIETQYRIQQRNSEQCAWLTTRASCSWNKPTANSTRSGSTNGSQAYH